MALENKRLSLIFDMVDKITSPARRVAHSVDALGAEFGKSKTKVDGLSKTMADVSALKTAQRAMNEAGEKAKQAASKVAQLKVQMALVEKPTKAMRAELAQANREARATDKEFRKLEGAAGALDDKLRKAGVDTRNLAGESQRLGREVNAATAEMNKNKTAMERAAEAQRQVNAARERHTATLEKMNKAQEQANRLMGAGAKVMAGGAAMVAGNYAAGSVYRSFDAQMSAVQATGGMDSATKERLAKLARDEAKISAWGAVDAANAQEFLAMAGFDEKAISASLRGVMNLASATKTGLAETADISTNILSGFGLDPAEMARVSDVLTKVTSTANTNLTELGGAMKYVAPVAKSAGYEIESVAAAAGLMANVGIKDSQAGTALRASILRMASLPKAAQKAFAELGVETADAKGNLRGLEYVLADVAKATEHMGSAERLKKLSAMFGVEASAGLAELLDKSSGDDMMNYIKKLEAAAGATDTAAATRLKNLDGDLKVLSSGIEEVRLKYGESLDKLYRGIVRFTTKVVERVDEWMAANPKLVKAIGLVTAVLGGLLVASGALLVGLGALFLMWAKMRLTLYLVRWAFAGVLKSMALSTAAFAWQTLVIMKNVAVWALYVSWLAISRTAMAAWAAGAAILRGVMVAVTATQWAFNAALTANPIGLIIAGIAALVAAGVWLYQNWDVVCEKFSAVWEKIKGLMSMNPMDLFQAAWQPVAEFFEGLWDSILATMMNKINAMTAKIKGFASWALGGFGMFDEEVAADGAAQAQPAKVVQSAGITPAKAPVQVNDQRKTEIVIHAAPGMDTEELGRVVERKLAERDRQQAREQRARLGD